jgi:H+/Cl- antiporter ClcA
MLPFFLVIGVVFGGLAAVAAYLISYHEYRQQMLRPDQDPRRMALGTAAVTFLFFVVGAIGLSLALGPRPS